MRLLKNHHHSTLLYPNTMENQWSLVLPSVVVTVAQDADPAKKKPVKQNHHFCGGFEWGFSFPQHRHAALLLDSVNQAIVKR
ncbi:MAG: hypothetical protein Q8M98_00540 [Candidatus Cloacimonadaceae bacterium]|nr:hypothetical protein [Candidatus Cloacimonadaceae bacterium]